jgi:Ran GTPase-activating protein (RanGAP) involved in mRNA processing and transport
MRILASVFIFMPVLTQLRIRKNNIGSEGTAYLANAIRNAQALSRLTVLDISENAIEAQGMEALAFVLNYVPNLTELNLGQNKIGNAGAKSLSQAIRNKRLSAVTLLSLDDNNIGDEGMEALSLAFSTRPSPAIDVYLTNNSITVHTKKRRVENVSFKFDKV